MIEKIGLLLLFPIQLIAQSATIKKIDAYCTAQAQHYNFSGVVLIAKGPTVLYQKAFGQAARQWNIANTLHTKFQIASLTKQFTAAMILKLVEEGKLSLNDKLTRWFPHYPKGDSVTVHMLLNHTAGIRNLQAIQPRFANLRSRPLPADSVIALFKDEPYDFSPGTAWNYSNSAYYLLGKIIEQASGKSLAAALRQLGARLGLANTGLLRSDTILPQLASGYVYNSSRWQPTLVDAPEIAFSAGAMVSTAADMHRWQEALHGGKVLEGNMYQKMITPGRANYGYGLWIDSLWGRKIIRHTGSIPGFQNNAFYFPDEKLHVIILSNRGEVRAPPFMSRALAGIYFGEAIAPSPKRMAQPLTAKGLEAVSGDYETEYLTFSVLVKEGRFWLQNGTRLLEWKQYAPDAFFLADGTDTTLIVDRDATGKATGLRLLRNGMESPVKKLK